MIFDAAKRGLMLWFEQLIPALFPFLILSNLLVFYLGKARAGSRKKHKKVSLFRKWSGLSPYGLYTLFMGHFCGYPAGAKITADLYTGGQIGRSEANYLLMIANQASPAFISSYLSAYALGRPALTLWIFGIFYLATVLTGLLVRPFLFRDCHKKEVLITACGRPSFMQILDSSINDAFSTLIRVGAYVILFSVLSAILLGLIPGHGTGKICTAAALEMTNGLAMLRESNLPEASRCILMMACTAFGGFSTMAQIKGMLIGTSLSIKPYIIGKCIYTLIVLILTKLFFVHILFI